jgi:hypothetical protein
MSNALLKRLERLQAGRMGRLGTLCMDFAHTGDNDALDAFRRDVASKELEGYRVIAIYRGGAPGQKGAIVIRRSYGVTAG